MVDDTKTILIVDDEPDVRATVRTILEKEGYSVEEARDANDCLEKIKNIHPDLILLDIMMPGTPVKEILPKIKAYKTALVSVLRKDQADEKGLLVQENVVDFLEKPLDIKFFIEKIKKILAL